MGSLLEGAVFIDAGNVWLKNQSDARPGGEFEFKTFWKQMAVATGVGIRLDLQFVLVRLDLGIPLRKPYNAEGNRWVVDEISIDKDWRRDNLIWNIAIGYPF